MNILGNEVDGGSAMLLSIATLFGTAAGALIQINFWYAVVCAGIAIICIFGREFVKK